jgi:hypothetical protein
MLVLCASTLLETRYCVYLRFLLPASPLVGQFTRCLGWHRSLPQSTWTCVPCCSCCLVAVVCFCPLFSTLCGCCHRRSYPFILDIILSHLRLPCYRYTRSRYGIDENRLAYIENGRFSYRTFAPAPPPHCGLLKQACLVLKTGNSKAVCTLYDDFVLCLYKYRTSP